MAGEPTNQTVTEDPGSIDQDLFCPQCTYNLRGLVEGRCPECGQTFDLASLTVSQIPWSRRERIGRMAAYWRTVWMVTAQAGRVGQEHVRPVDYGEAQRFRWITILHVQLTALALTLAGYAIGPADLFSSTAFDGWFKAVWLVAAVNVALFLFLAASTGVPSYLFQIRSLPRAQQNRLIALSYYTSAPLALTPLVMALLIGSLQLGITLDLFDRGPMPVRIAVTTMFVIALLALILQPILWWRSLLVLAWRGVPENRSRAIIVATVVPLLWMVLAVLIFGGVPAVTAYMGIFLVNLAP